MRKKRKRKSNQSLGNFKQLWNNKRIQNYRIKKFEVIQLIETIYIMERICQKKKKKY